MYFRNNGHPKTLLDKNFKSAVSQYSSTRNLVNVLKHYSNHHGGTFIIFIDHREGYWV